MFIISLILYIIISYLTGQILVSKPNSEQNNLSQSIAYPVTVGIAAHLLLSHLINYLTKNILLSIELTMAFALVLIAINYKSYIKGNTLITKFKELSAPLTMSFVLALIYSVKDFLYSNPDNIHIAFSSSIINNNIYPPSFPVAKEISMGSYHYGINIITSIIQLIPKSPTWDATSIQIGLGVFLVALLVYEIFNSYTKSNKASITLTLIIFLFSSINSVDYILKEIMQMPSGQDLRSFLSTWAKVSTTSVGDLGHQLSLPGQNFGFVFAFALIIQILSYFNNSAQDSKSQYLAIFLCSFALYFCYPTYWYPIVTSFALALIIEYLFKRRSYVGLLMIITMLLGKYAILNIGNLTSSIDGLSFKPHLSWVTWFLDDINYFYLPNYFSNFATCYDYISEKSRYMIPVFSSLSFRNFGFISCLACAIASYNYFIQKSKINSTAYFFIAGCISLMPAFMLEYILRPVETIRFIFFSNVMFSLYILITLYQLKDTKLLRFHKLNNFSKITINTIIVIALTPGLLNLIPIRDFINTDYSISKTNKQLLTDLLQIHKSGQVILQSQLFKNSWVDFTSVAGYYGVSGLPYKYDSHTRRTALYLLSPKLLNELNVNYVLIQKNDRISKKGLERLADKDIFRELTKIHQRNPDYKLYRFLGTIDDSKEYAWTLGIEQKQQLIPVRFNYNQIVLSSDKKKADLYVEKLKIGAFQNDLATKMSLKSYPIIL